MTSVNPVSHFEIPADNLERAKKFYAAAFGWQLAPFREDYIMLGTTPVGPDMVPKTPGAINGGLLKRGGPMKNVTVSVVVPDIQAAIRKVETSGGSLVEKPIRVGDMGTVAYVKDSEGNVLGLWQDAKA